MPSLIDFLHQAIQAGENIKIVYNGGSTPGRARYVFPIALSKNKLTAREIDGSLAKHFNLDKISSASSLDENVIAQPTTAAPGGAIEIIAIPVFSTLAEYAEYLRDTLHSKGWNVIEQTNTLGVGLFFKNGKPKKTLNIYIEFVDRSTDVVFDWETGETTSQPRNMTGRERPWSVTSWRRDRSRSFVDLHHAASFFAEEALLYEPPTI